MSGNDRGGGPLGHQDDAELLQRGALEVVRELKVLASIIASVDKSLARLAQHRFAGRCSRVSVRGRFCATPQDGTRAEETDRTRAPENPASQASKHAPAGPPGQGGPPFQEYYEPF
jgi:hypothetical protein